MAAADVILKFGVCGCVCCGFPSSINAMIHSSPGAFNEKNAWQQTYLFIIPLLIVFLVNICACSEDGSLNCGYSSIRGRRASMEDFYDIRSSRIDDKQINLFGVFDGQAFTSLKHLFCTI